MFPQGGTVFVQSRSRPCGIFYGFARAIRPIEEGQKRVEQAAARKDMPLLEDCRADGVTKVDGASHSGSAGALWWTECWHGDGSWRGVIVRSWAARSLGPGV